MWEGIGVASFLLISFWYTRISAVKAAIQALTMNRVGDMMLSLGLFGMFALFGNLDYGTVFSLAPFVNETTITIVVLLLFIGATAKSAQIPLHVWLPASMEGLNLFTIFVLLRKYMTLIYNFFLIITFLTNFIFITIDECSALNQNLTYEILDYFIFDSATRQIEMYVAIIGRIRDKRGRFISVPITTVEPLASTVRESLIGELLGDGCLRYTGKVNDGNPSPNKNVIYAMTLKNYDHINYL